MIQVEQGSYGAIAGYDIDQDFLSEDDGSGTRAIGSLLTCRWYLSLLPYDGTVIIFEA